MRIFNRTGRKIFLFRKKNIHHHIVYIIGRRTGISLAIIRSVSLRPQNEAILSSYNIYIISSPKKTHKCIVPLQTMSVGDWADRISVAA